MYLPTQQEAGLIFENEIVISAAEGYEYMVGKHYLELKELVRVERQWDFKTENLF